MNCLMIQQAHISLSSPRSRAYVIIVLALSYRSPLKYACVGILKDVLNHPQVMHQIKAHWDKVFVVPIEWHIIHGTEW